MRAIILAAGIGSRLRPITDKKPKTLVTVNNRPILHYIIDALLANKINDIVICTGYKRNLIKDFCSRNYPQLDFQFVDNKDYDSTNNLYSLYLAREHMNGDFLLMNADLVFDKSVISKLIESKVSAFCIDEGVYMEESMKVTIDGHGSIASISKGIIEQDAYGVSIDVYLFKWNDCATLQSAVATAIERDKRLNDWTEALLNDLLIGGKIEIQPVNIHGVPWYEIDNFNDLSIAEKMFNPYIPTLMERKVFVFDVDGTIALGKHLFPETKAIFSYLISEGRTVYIVTNNSSRTTAEYRGKLQATGLDTSSIIVLSSLDITLDYLHDHNYTRICWIASPTVENHILSRGFKYDEISPHAVLLTYDTTINYEKLTTLVRLLNEGTAYFATHTDMVCPTENGYAIPDIGCIIQLLESTTGRRPFKTFGKPNRGILDRIIEKENVVYDDIAVFGDRLYTDIALTSGTGSLSALVLTGETTREAYEESDIKANIIFDSISDLIII